MINVKILDIMIPRGEANLPYSLPKGFYAREDLRKIVRSNFDATLNLIPPLPSNEVTLQTLEQLEPRTYALGQRPKLSLLRELPKFRGGAAEVGVFSINGKWLVTLGTDLLIELPKILDVVVHDGLFQADIHSHPGNGPDSEQPSKEDIWHLDSTIDGKNYIISRVGIVEFQKPIGLPGGFNLRESEESWKYWITQELNITEDQYNQQGGWELKNRFYKFFFGLRTIPWDKEQEIEALLASKENLMHGSLD